MKIQNIQNSMTFPWLLAKFSFSMTFSGPDFILLFSMVFHDFPWPREACLMLVQRRGGWPNINPFKPEFTIVIFVHYKPRIAVAILNL